jgi:Fur family ferric uptake transcriptional regulator/Fur family zinc uptake transcriptional regulator
VNDAEGLLRQAGARVTAARVRVLAALLRAGCPVSQQELARLTRQTGLADCDRVTLYRTLNRLREAGLAHAVEGVDGSWRFCAHSPDTPGCPGNHPHFLCLSCGTMICLTAQRLPRVEVPPGSVVQGKQLVVYGRCGPCARRKAVGARRARRKRASAPGLRGRRPVR